MSKNSMRNRVGTCVFWEQKDHNVLTKESTRLGTSKQKYIVRKVRESWIADGLIKPTKEDIELGLVK